MAQTPHTPNPGGGRAPLPRNASTCENSLNLMGSYVSPQGVLRLVNFFHSMAHLKNGLDLADVTTSPNDPAAFTGHHANVDRNNMIWQRATAATLRSKYWGYPRSTNDVASKGRSPATISGPFATYDAGVCGGDTSTFSEYNVHAPPAWLPGSTLDDVVNAGFPFTRLFDCTHDEVDATGTTIRCTGEPGGYTHREILYWTSPGRSPYVYDSM